MFIILSVKAFTEAIYKVGRRSTFYKPAMDAQGLEMRLGLYDVDNSYVLLSLPV